MDSSKNNNNNNNNNNFVSEAMQRGEEDFLRTAFEYTFPTNDDDDTESNKSTPYFTPMEFLQSPFEFPAPLLPDAEKIDISGTSAIAAVHPVSAVTVTNASYIAQPANSEIENVQVMMQPRELEIEKHSSRIMQSCSKSIIKHLEPSSPNVQKKFRRFSLYERRSCSPQHLILKNSSSVECTVETDKENTKPKLKADKNDETNSGNNSPSLILDETGSPRILTSSEAAMLSSGRLTFSPKLLTSINNLHLSSPLGVISSAGYKNGNYFKFPEIDHVVQDVQVPQTTSAIADNKVATYKDNQTVKCVGAKGAPLSLTQVETPEAELRAISSSMDSNTTSAIQPKTETKRNCKNKNNLTIKIMNSSSPSTAVQTQKYFNTTISQSKLPSSPSSNKPKTPTIKSTKEKALSLDSAPQTKDCLKSLQLKPEQLNLSCDEIDSSLPEDKQSALCKDRLKMKAPNSISTSLSQLAAQNSNIVNKLNKTAIRRRIPNSTSAEWQLHQRKHASFNIPDMNKKVCENRDDRSASMLKDAKALADSQTTFAGLSTPISANCAPTSATHRPAFKHNPLLHNSNTNLKTLPEFLTLVEFSTPSGVAADPPFKQKSMDIPSSTVSKSQVKTVTSSPSTNLLQRRGSNHSLTLNLHGSCSNLLGSCRSGLSVSNYSLGSVASSTNNLNSKSSCNLNISTSQNSQNSNALAISANQGAKQSLFRRRGSNQSLTLTNLTATSCGNLNTFASQNSLNVERPQLAPLSRPTANASLGAAPRRGLLERRGSNQSLTLNMSSSFGGIGSEKGILGISNMNLGDSKQEEEIKPSHQQPLASNCSIHSHQRRFFSSEGLNRNNAQFSDLGHDHKRNANQGCFGSVTDLKPNERGSSDKIASGRGNIQPEHFDFQESSSVCTCSTGIRNIMTKPLSPQTTSEEFKIYLANIQMLQNASNALNQNDLIKLNYIFDNSYAANSKSLTEQSLHILSIPAPNKEADTPPAVLTSNSEDCEIIERYLFVVKEVLHSLQLDDEEQKRVFRSLHKEFWDLPLNHQEKPMVFGSQTKNRYKTILPNENSRVILEKESKQLMEMVQNYTATGDDATIISDLTQQISTSDEVPYINANYIKGPDYTSKCYIATQGPLPNTIYEFWLMTYQNTKKYIEISKGPKSPSCCLGKSLQQYYQKIVMLTNFMENNRQKCSIYFPVDLNEIFISTSKDEVVQPSAMFADFINAILLDSESSQDNCTMPKANSFEENVQTIAMDTIKARVETELEAHLPHNSSFFVIKNVGIVRKNGYSIRKLIILYCAKFAESVNYLLINKFYCYHYWYPDWPDHRSPRDINTLLDISLHVMNLGKCESEFELFNETDTSPPKHINSQPIELYQQDIFNAVQPLPVIHCSAGIGRTGCLAAILNGIRQVRQSLAYSLTSMATNAAKRASALQALSPVDFRLPKEFLEEDSISAHLLLPNDIDCSFTRNTLIYIRYILKMEQKIKEEENETATDADCGVKAYNMETPWTLPSLAELPKMSNIFVDILGIVCNLRLQRGGMVQNSEQYELIHRAICLYLKRTFALKRF